MEMSTAWHGQWMITAGSHYIDQCSSPGHLPCAIVSLTSKSSSGSPYLLHSTIHPQPTSLKPQYNPLHVSADCSPCPEDVLHALICTVSLCLLPRKSFVLTLLSKSYQFFEARLKSYFIPKVDPLISIKLLIKGHLRDCLGCICLTVLEGNSPESKVYLFIISESSEIFDKNAFHISSAAWEDEYQLEYELIKVSVVLSTSSCVISEKITYSH